MELNWHQFAANYNNKETFAFEQLCYQLFCSEHNQKVGIFRFKNQPGIETEPIVINGDKIGFQSKYYTTAIAKNKGDIIDSVDKAKKRDNDLKTIYFYLNKEFGFNPKDGKKDPAYKIEIEEAAKKLDTTLVWRVQSHLEIQLSLPENRYIYDKYFTQNGGVSKLIDGLVDHTKNLFFSIHSEISYLGNSIKIDRTDELNKLGRHAKPKNSIVISGVGGCGKTALVKDYFESLDPETPFYLFKATEFKVEHIHTIFSRYGSFSLLDFIEFHKDERSKIFVFDSAERISDLENHGPIKELIASLIQHDWTLIFTTRESYFESLIFHFIDVFEIEFEPVNVKTLSEAELEEYSQKYSFVLPTNLRLREFILNPFYLREYLDVYDESDRDINLPSFRQKVWAKTIQHDSFTKDNMHLQREKAFLDIVRSRSHDEGFFVSSESPPEVLSLLVSDEILSYDDDQGGYFITHDVYEEWGLDVLIRRAYLNKKSYQEFVKSIGESLIVRRAFRNWLYAEINEKPSEIVDLVKSVIDDREIDVFWKDEILISILLSDNSNQIIEEIEGVLLDQDYKLLNRALFLLRLACKEIDVDLANLLVKEDKGTIKFVFTKPRGNGWNALINLLFKYKNDVSISNNPLIFPILKDWNMYNRSGVTTQQASLLTLQNYVNIFDDKEAKIYPNISKDYFDVIAQGSSTIEDELGDLLQEIIDQNYIWRGEPYYDFSEYLLKLNHVGLGIIKSHPELLMRILAMNWFKSTPPGEFPVSRIGLEEHYGLFHHRTDYSPSSAYQSPVYWLLKFHPSTAFDFVIDIVNKCVNNYKNSKYDDRLREIHLEFEDGTSKKQIVSHGLWGAYRGIGSPSVPNLIESMHMALEMSLLEYSDKWSNEELEALLLKLLTKSDSGSITAVVTSIVLACPDRLFNIEKILFKSPEVFIYDKSRWSSYVIDSMSSNWSGIGYSGENELHQIERTKSQNHPNRKEYLEQTILNYQIAPNQNLPEDFIIDRRDEINKILDSYYSSLPPVSEQSGEDKSLRILLTRIDGRKMKPKIIERVKDKLLVQLEPEIDEDLRVHSEEATREGADAMRYTNMKMWSDYRLNGKGDYKQFDEFEENPSLVITKIKEIIEQLDAGDYSFRLFNHAIPAFCCAVLIRDFSSSLSNDNKNYCREIVLSYVNRLFNETYNYQLSDGVEVSFRSIPYLIKEFQELKIDLFSLLLKVLIFEPRLINREHTYNNSIIEIRNVLWSNESEYTDRLLLAYITFKPIFNETKERLSKGKKFGWLRNEYRRMEINAIDEFDSKFKKKVAGFFIDGADWLSTDLDQLSLEELSIVFQLIPKETEDNDHIDFVRKIIPRFSSFILQNDRELRGDYDLRLAFNRTFVQFVLFRNNDEHITELIDLLFINFTSSQESVDLLKAFIYAEDEFKRTHQFWLVWYCIYDKVIGVLSSRGLYNRQMIDVFLLSGIHWKEGAYNWSSLQIEHKDFYSKIINDIGYYEQVFKSLAILVNSIGSIFINESINWFSQLSDIHKRGELDQDTVFHIELTMRKYAHLNRIKIKHHMSTKTSVVKVLTLLVENGSVNAYLLREDLL